MYFSAEIMDVSSAATVCEKNVNRPAYPGPASSNRFNSGSATMTASGTFVGGVSGSQTMSGFPKQVLYNSFRLPKLSSQCGKPQLQITSVRIREKSPGDSCHTVPSLLAMVILTSGIVRFSTAFGWDGMQYQYSGKPRMISHPLCHTNPIYFTPYVAIKCRLNASIFLVASSVFFGSRSQR